MVAGGSLWNVFWSLIDDAELRQDVATTKHAAPIDSHWDLQSPRIFEEIFFRFFIANQHHDVTRYPNILSDLSCHPPLHELFLMKLQLPWTCLVNIFGSLSPYTLMAQSPESLVLSRKYLLLFDLVLGSLWTGRSTVAIFGFV